MENESGTVAPGDLDSASMKLHERNGVFNLDSMIGVLFSCNVSRHCIGGERIAVPHG